MLRCTCPLLWLTEVAYATFTFVELVAVLGWCMLGYAVGVCVMLK